MSIDDMHAYHQDWYVQKRKDNPDYAAKRREYRLANYEKVRAQEILSRTKNIEKHRADSRARMVEYRKTERYEEIKIGRSDRELERKYGLTRQQWTDLFLSQSSSCAVCRATEPGSNHWHTDHCHSTGKVRGILCQHCNIMLGQAKDSAKTLAAAIEYLIKHATE